VDLFEAFESIEFYVNVCFFWLVEDVGPGNVPRETSKIRGTTENAEELFGSWENSLGNDTRFPIFGDRRRGRRWLHARPGNPEPSDVNPLEVQLTKIGQSSP
jgi:hypothetical protein